MKLISKRKEIITTEYVTIELDKEQLLAVIAGLGATSSAERIMELRSFYNVKEDFVDKGQELYDELTDMMGMGSLYEVDETPPAPKMPERPENSSPNAFDF